MSSSVESKSYKGKYPCIHGKNKYTCKECRGCSLCSHGLVKSQCKDCRGSGICDHGRVRSQCKDCGGPGICDHGRVKSQCKDCGGSGLCEHGRRKSRCKVCGGGRKRTIDVALSTDQVGSELDSVCGTKSKRDSEAKTTKKTKKFDRLKQLRDENETRLVSNSPASRALHIG